MRNILFTGRNQRERSVKSLTRRLTPLKLFCYSRADMTGTVLPRENPGDMTSLSQAPPFRMNIKDYLEQKREVVDRYLLSVIPAVDQPPATLHESMRYSLFAGGKRVRPILAIAAAEAVGDPGAAILPIASSLELIHTYSLIHDDLPSMDDDDYRRGKPTNHKVYGEAMAILAGDALLTMAFELCSQTKALDGLDPARQVRLVHELAVGSGNRGMVGGQVLDIQAENKDIQMA